MDPVSWTTILSVGGTAVSTYGAVQASNAQAQQDMNNAAIAEENRKSAIFESNVAAQEKDFEARAELGALLAGAGASGLNMGSGSKALQRKSATELAAKDRGRIINQGEVEAAQYEQQRDDYLASAESRKTTTWFTALGGAVDMGTSYIDGATKVDKRKLKTTLAG